MNIKIDLGGYGWVEDGILHISDVVFAEQDLKMRFQYFLKSMQNEVEKSPQQTYGKRSVIGLILAYQEKLDIDEVSLEIEKNRTNKRLRDSILKLKTNITDIWKDDEIGGDGYVIGQTKWVKLDEVLELLK